MMLRSCDECKLQNLKLLSCKQMDVNVFQALQNNKEDGIDLDDEWICEECDFLNQNIFGDKCVFCSNKWKCPKCGLFNNQNQMRCIVCKSHCRLVMSDETFTILLVFGYIRQFARYMTNDINCVCTQFYGIYHPKRIQRSKIIFSDVTLEEMELMKHYVEL